LFCFAFVASAMRFCCRVSSLAILTVCVVVVMAAMSTGSPLNLANSSSGSGEFQQLDVHLKLSSEALKYIEGSLSDQINALVPHNDISFNTTIPHVTLYLTEYVSANISNVVSTLDILIPRLAKRIGSCRIPFGKPYAQGAYYMWRTVVPDCLQEITDNLTLELAKFRNVNQEVPDWVYTLPEPERSERIAMVKQYGSPNVFKYFDPHVTLAWSDQDDLTKLEELKYPQFRFKIEEIGLGVVSDHGTVLRDKDVAHWIFK